ncbi:1-aminocyclopropane-1-carboxylate synthase-like protein 1 isoform X2 [Lytechinus pictus]|uniref:1-aminocyclopropane-1-carboxylate synthase-like protein 1 isoform X2 n=1 Tax=Lytechinus pictus TaxID=7653 RepID=UPI0030B9D919
MATSNFVSKAISQRARNMFAFDFPLKILFEKMTGNPYHEDNKDGIINLSTAYNEAVKDVITEKFNQQELKKWDSSMLPYPSHCQGAACMRKVIADFLSAETNAAQVLDPEKMVIMAGVTAVINVMAFILCNPGDTVLTPSPMYGGIPRDIKYQAEVNTYPVYLSSKAEPDGREPYELTVQLLEEALEKAKQEGHKVKALILVNPFNPCGTVYTRQQVLEYLKFCHKHSLHCVIDEIYNCSIYDDSVQSSSIFTFNPDDLPDKDRTHVLWGMAKDFGMPGSPVGVAYTWNPSVLAALIALVDFYQVPLFLQIAVTKVLKDKEWLKWYLSTQKSMLLESSNIVQETLDELGVQYMKPVAGLFLWADFRKFIPNATKESEMAFSMHCLDNGIAIAPASSFYYNEYGWARIVHTLPKEILIEAMKRLKASCRSFQG